MWNAAWPPNKLMFAHVCPQLWSVLEGCGIFRKLSLAGEVGHRGQVSRFGSSSPFPVGSLLPACGHAWPSTSCFCCHAFPATVYGSFFKLEVEVVASSLKLLLVVIATRKVTICYMFEVLEFTLKWDKIVFLFVCLYLCMCAHSYGNQGLTLDGFLYCSVLMFWDGHSLNLVFTDSVTLMGSRDDHGRTDVSIRHWLHYLWDSWVMW